MSECKNEQMNLAGTGKQKFYPRSCLTCGFSGTCARGITRDPSSTIEELYYVGGKRNVDKYAVLYKQTIHHAGDERSRTNPGHGYPTYNEDVDCVKVFQDEAGLKEWIEKNDSGYSRKPYTAIKFQELTVRTETVISLL